MVLIATTASVATVIPAVAAAVVTTILAAFVLAGLLAARLLGACFGFGAGFRLRFGLHAGLRFGCGRDGCGGRCGFRLGAGFVATAATAAFARSALAILRGVAFGLAVVARRRVATGKSCRRVDPRQRGFQQLLDRGQILVVGRHGDADRGAKTARAAGAPDAVDIVLGMAGQVIVEDVADRRDVQAARRDVGRDQQAQLAVAERFQRAGPLALVQVAVDRGRVVSVFRQRLGDDVDVRLAVAEDDGVGQPLALGVDQGAQQVALLLGGHVAAGGGQLDQALRDRLAGRGLARDLDPFGRVQEGVGDPLDLGGHGGAEEQRLAGEGRQLEDALDIGDEAHVQHAVGLVDDHDLNAGQQQLAALDMVQQAARGGDQHVHAAVDQLVLFAEADAADQQRLGQAGVLGIGVEILGHLGGQFTRGAQHQAARHARAGPATAQQRDHRQGEAGGLAGSGLRDPQHVAAFQGGRDRPLLDGRRRLVAGFQHGLQHFGVQLQIRELGHSGLSIKPRPFWRDAFQAARPSGAVAAKLGRKHGRPALMPAGCRPASRRPKALPRQSFAWSVPPAGRWRGAFG